MARTLPTVQTEESMNAEQTRIAQWLKKVRFRKRLFGGVSEVDVWKKLNELNALYEAALRAERVRYDAMLEERIRTGDGQ